MEYNLNFDISSVDTPCFVVDEKLLENNLEVLKKVKEESGTKILLAQKAFSMYSVYPLIKKYLDGTTASGLFEAKLGYEEMGGETHIFSPAYKKQDFKEIVEICDHIIFNSINQYEKFIDLVVEKEKSAGLRVNPEFSTQDHPIYDPCSPFSRLGITLKNFPKRLPENVEGLHFHTLCEQNSKELLDTLNVVKDKFSGFFNDLKWINFGGGHHITRKDYDIELLISTIKDFKEEFNLEVYLEPGEAVALNTGFLVATVVDIINNGMEIAILDTSAACHMPDVLEMPYRPEVIGGANPNEKKYTYRLGTNTCLAGDIIGDYSFDEELKEGDRLVFLDMAIYSMVKTNMFNGINLPKIYLNKINEGLKLVKEFDFSDYKSRI